MKRNNNNLAAWLKKGLVASIDGKPVNAPKGRTERGQSNRTLHKSKPRTARQAEGNPDYKGVNPELDSIIRRAKATLIIQGRAVRSTNALQWKHWIYHLEERNAAAEKIDNATWLIPYGNEIPKHHNGQKQHLIFVWRGRRLMDRVNFANGCKKILDELVERGYLVNDDPNWLRDEYYPELDTKEQLEIHFMGPC